MPWLITNYIDAIFTKNTFNGRSSRSEYWGFTIMNWLISAVIWINTGGKKVIFPRSEVMVYDKGYLILFIAMFIFAIFLWFAQWTIQVRRLHDTGKSGWRILIEIIPLFGAILMFLWLTEKGDEGENQYGEIPK